MTFQYKGQLRGASTDKGHKCNGPCKQKVNTRLKKNIIKRRKKQENINRK